MNKSFLQRAAAFISAIIFEVALFCGCGGGSSAGGGKLPELVIGVDYYAPFVFRDDEGEFAGLDVELAKEVCRHMGFEPKFVRVEWSEKKSYLESDEIDCLWCCFSETGREGDYAWSLPYMNSRQVVAVRENSDIRKIADLDGKRVAVQATTKTDEIFFRQSGCKNGCSRHKATELSAGYFLLLCGDRQRIRRCDCRA